LIILGAEVSYLVQNGRDLLVTPVWDPSLREAEGMLAILSELWRAHRDGTNPVEFERLRNVTSLHSNRLHELLHYLERHNLVLECALSESPEKGAYALARDISDIRVGKLLEDFFQSARSDTAVGQFWNTAVEKWSGSFDDVKIEDLVQENGKKKKRG